MTGSAMEFWREALGWIGSAVLVASIVQPTITRLRWVNLVAAVLLTAYNLLLGSAPMVALNVVLVIVNAWHLRKAGRPSITKHRNEPSDQPHALGVDGVKVDRQG